MKILLRISPFLFFFLLACRQNEQTISYNDHIRPILNQKCLACHGGVKKEGGFSLLFREEAMGEMESGKVAIYPGNHKKSEVYARIISNDPELRMPHEADPLSEEEIQLITQWIDEGAQWEDHWAYLPPAMPEIPSASIVIPSEAEGWGENNVDKFIYKRMTEEGFEPSERANVNVLLRRLSLDLIGLPPNEDLMNKYLNNTSPEAYEQLVDELLASPHFGERWAAMWLDLSRYADSQGYEKDPHRNIWRFRDWVINAFNEDMPFDQFTIEQLAGDLLDNPSRDQLIATAFNRNSMTNTEGGTDDEEFRITAVIDRLTTTFDVWQGTTIGCVQCHSHPYDPIRHKEFYELMAVFNNTMDADLSEETPNIELYQEEDEEEIEKLISYIQELDSDIVIDDNAPTSTKIRQAVFPKLIPIQCDDFKNVIFYGSALINWANNLSVGISRDFHFKFDNIDLTGVTHISYLYDTKGNDAQLELHLDSIAGPIIQELGFESNQHLKEDKSKKGDDRFGFKKVEITPTTGKHDLVFDLINTTGEIPEGSVTILSIELHYDSKYVSNEKINEYKADLSGLRSKADYTPIMQPKSDEFHRTTHVFERGNFNVFWG